MDASCPAVVSIHWTNVTCGHGECKETSKHGDTLSFYKINYTSRLFCYQQPNPDNGMANGINPEQYSRQMQTTCRMCSIIRILTQNTQRLKMVNMSEDGNQREMGEDVQSLGSLLTNSILCCCSCFHGAPTPSLLLVPSRSVCLSPHAHKRTFTHTQVSEMGFSRVSKSTSNRCSERESLILQHTLHLTTIPRIVQPHNSILLLFLKALYR